MADWEGSDLLFDDRRDRDFAVAARYDAAGKVPCWAVGCKGGLSFLVAPNLCLCTNRKMRWLSRRSLDDSEPDPPPLLTHKNTFSSGGFAADMLLSRK